MKQTIRLLFFVLSCQAAIGTTLIPTDSIQVVPTNAASHDVSFSYNQTNQDVTIIVSYKKGEQRFDGATLQCTNSAHRFSVPIKGFHPDMGENKKDMILISFIMDRELVRECTLKIFYTKGTFEGTGYALSLKDFVPAQPVRGPSR